LTDPSVASEPDSDDEVTLIRRADSDEEGKEGEAGGAEIEANGDDEGEDDGNEEEGEEDDDQDKSTTPDMIQFPEVPVADLVDTSGDAEPARLQTPTVATSPLPSSAMPQILDTQHPTTIPATPNKPQSESKKEPTTRGSRSSRRRQSRRPPTPPPPQPEHPDSPLSHLDASFNVLLSGGRDGRLAFRVHTPTSVSPLQWTGDERTSGFASANWHLGRLTPTAYTRALAAASAPSAGTRPPPSSPGIPLSDVNAIPLGASRYATFPGLPAHSAGGGAGARDPWPNWTAGAGVRQSLADHLTRKPRLRAHDPGDGQLIPPDALSPWISASADAQWAVWEAARLVGLGEPVVEIAVIALEVSCHYRRVLTRRATRAPLARSSSTRSRRSATTGGSAAAREKGAA
jgi:hypothetical protein